MNIPSVFQFRITLKGVTTKELEAENEIYRDIEVPVDMDFYGFHVAIQDAMGWKDCHLYDFRDFSFRPNVTYSIGVPGDAIDAELYDFETRSDRDHFIGDYFKRLSDTALYVYDFGDDWEHEIRLVGLLTKDPHVRYPRCVGGKGVCPPEDSHRTHLEIISNPQCEEYEEYMSWLNDIGYDVTVTTFDHSKVVMSDAELRWFTINQPETETDTDE